jgi:hypothetical protein
MNTLDFTLIISMCGLFCEERSKPTNASSRNESSKGKHNEIWPCLNNIKLKHKTRNRLDLSETVS